MDTEISIPLMWFLLGVVSCRFAATMINYSHGGTFIQEINRHALILIGMMSEDIHFIKQRKYLLLEEADVPEKEIKFIKEMDKKVFDNWQLTVISRFFNSYPRYLHKLIPFRSWDEAMEELTKIHKKDNTKTSD